MVQASAKGSKAAGDWHFVVVCGESGWKEYAAFSQLGEAQLADASADTDFASKTTFLRGTRLVSSDATASVIARSMQVLNANDVQIALK